MQLLNSPPGHVSSALLEKSLMFLQDIASKVKIESHFCIHHSDYKPLKLSDKIVPRMQQVSSSFQDKFLQSQLCNFLYGIYYNGFLRHSLVLDSNLKVCQNLGNSSYCEIDVSFTERLRSCNSGKGYFNSGWQIFKQGIDQTLSIRKSQPALHIEPKNYPQTTEQSTIISNLVAIRVPFHLAQNGFYMAIGNAGYHSSADLDTHAQLVSVSFNISAEGAVAIMHHLTQQLNTLVVPFCFKVLCNPSDYKRYDSAVLYFNKSHYTVIRQVLQSVYTECRSHFDPQVPSFTKCLAPGLGLAEEPNHKLTAYDSFGMNRCQIVTKGLIEARQQGDESLDNRMTLILKQFAHMGVELQRPYLSHNSEDIYTRLEEVTEAYYF